MKILGLVVEYNPFHNGHLYHLNHSKKITQATHTVAVMSGNFLQRGEPALIHKWIRAQMAVDAGVDLVVELPVVYACSTAEFFAYGALSLLNNMGVVDCICFGSEHGNINLLEEISDIILNPTLSYKNNLKDYMKMGYLFPVARTLSLIDYFSSKKQFSSSKLNEIQNVLKNPNNILGIEYIKAIKVLNSRILPYTISRIKAGYHSTNIDSDIASASAIRKYLQKNMTLEPLKKVLPPSTYALLLKAFNESIGPIFSHNYEKALITILRRSTQSSFDAYFDVKEGLENKIFKCATSNNTLSDLYECIKSKRYTLTRIQRICMHILLDIQKKDVLYFNTVGGPQYIRVLALNDKGREILNHCKNKSNIPIINKIFPFIKEKNDVSKMLSIDIRATNIYSSCIMNTDYSNKQLDFIISPYYLGS